MRIALVLVFTILSGCSYYFEDDDDAPGDGDGDGDGDVFDDASVPRPDGGVLPDAAVGCDPVAILPVNYQPVEVVAEGQVGNEIDPDRPDVFLTRVNASAGGSAGQATQPFVYLDLTGENGAVKVEIDDPTSFGSDQWDIALKRFVIRSNSGDSGAADVEVATVPSDELTFRVDVPGELFDDDDWSTTDCTLVQDESGGPRTRFSNWYEVVSGRFEPEPVVHLVRLRTGGYAEIDIQTYYADEDNPDRSGFYLLRWRRF